MLPAQGKKTFLYPMCLSKRDVEMVGYRPRSVFVCLWPSTSSRSMNKDKSSWQYPVTLASRMGNYPGIYQLKVINNSVAKNSIISQTFGSSPPQCEV